MADIWVKVGTTEVRVEVINTGKRGVLAGYTSEMVYVTLPHNTPLRVVFDDGGSGNFTKDELQLIG